MKWHEAKRLEQVISPVPTSRTRSPSSKKVDVKPVVAQSETQKAVKWTVKEDHCFLIDNAFMDNKISKSACFPPS